MEKRNRCYLSHLLDEHTPTYGNRNRFVCQKNADISKGDVANDSHIATTVHIGTHIDMPYHFFEDGQTIEDFDIDFFSSDQILYITLEPNGIIKDELIELLETVGNKASYEFLIVKTGIGTIRHTDRFWQSNYGFDPSIAEYLRINFPNVRIIGFDSISVSSFENRMVGREAHRAFLDPRAPILILEDMDLTPLTETTHIKKMDIAPLRIAQCDGLPCTVLAEIT